MTDYVFILGKNWLLSLAEVLVALTDRGLDFELKDHSRHAAVIRTRRGLSDDEVVDMQQGLGGCFKTGRVVATYPRTLVERAFPARGRVRRAARSRLMRCEWADRVWPSVTGQRIKFGVSVYPMLSGQTSIDLKRLALGMDEWLKERLVERGAKKAVYYAYEGPDRRDPGRPNTALWPQTLARHALLTPPNAEILAVLTQDTMYVAKTIVAYDSVFQQYRDEGRPYVAAEITTSPKLCRTLLTLAGARPGDTVLDPFCGTGTLLMEAALRGMRCIGMDIDPEAVSGTQANLQWLARETGEHIDYTVILGDAREAAERVPMRVDAIAFEPHLGPLYVQTPAPAEARRVIRRLTRLYREALSSLSKLLPHSARLAMTVPIVNTTGQPVTVDIMEMTEGTGLEPALLLPSGTVTRSAATDERLRIRPDRYSIPERKRGQVVQRAVVMLQRL